MKRKKRLPLIYIKEKYRVFESVFLLCDNTYILSQGMGKNRAEPNQFKKKFKR